MRRPRVWRNSVLPTSRSALRPARSMRWVRSCRAAKSNTSASAAVAQQRRQQRAAVVGHEAADGAPQPVLRGVGQDARLGLGGAGRGLRARRGHERDAGVLGGQLDLAGLAGHVLAAGHHDVVALAVGVARHDDGGVALLQQQHRGQQQLVELGDGPLHQAGAEAGLGERADGLVGRQAPLHGQRGQQRLGAALAAVVARQPRDGVRQRVVVEVPAGGGVHGGLVVLSSAGRRRAGPAPGAPGARRRPRCRARCAARRTAATRGRARPGSGGGWPRAPGGGPA